MDDQEKQAYLNKYKLAKENGEYFFPEAIFKDAIVALVVFLLLVSLAYSLGAPLESRANPADTNYTPRPEWYFLFLFQLLKYFPGSLEVIGVVVIPTLAIILLLLLPVLDRSNKRHAYGRPIIVGVTALILSGIIFLTEQAYRETPPAAEAAAGTPCTLGNGWLRVLDWDRYALSLYDRSSRRGVRVWLDAHKTAAYPAIHDWSLKRRPKQALPLGTILDSIFDSRRAVLSFRTVIVTTFHRRPKKETVGICP